MIQNNRYLHEKKKELLQEYKRTRLASYKLIQQKKKEKWLKEEIKIQHSIMLW